ncbi:hypothetical protein [Amycolatopsis regifaucium]|uniref:Lipoprotein n=1 Tax=Amycolatopsis regifaucium TaxID=546365 RepID=A0A154MVB0_9PSEU|nr:hypothetical protein [Amycolatopsis regifaucium]KZB87687.1 hypothetical protein AVL48_24105 [Amycolatopsis regifaucium]OKA05511.1 hypothetical protein ATP06_0225820 [Amycolatopsis regifaucium]SFI13020.1 hypothetical protein SAMN04489731_108298 [Amycolatopsis regifaucium]
MRRTALSTVVFVLGALLGACDGETVAFADARALADGTTSAIDGKAAKFATDVTAGAMRSKSQGQARVARAGTALAMTTDFLGEPLELRLVDKIVFAKVPESAREDVPGGKPWVKVSADGADPFSQVAGGSIDQLAKQNDPGRALDQVRRAGTLIESGRTELDGASAERYRLDIDVAALGGDLPAGLSAEAVGELGGKLGKLPMELWLDDARRPLQVMLDLAPVLAASGAPDSAMARIVTRYTEWGTQADIQAPPPDQIGELPGG